MPRKLTRVSLKATSPLCQKDGDGNQIHNEILTALPPEECNQLLPGLEFVRLKLHQVLQDQGDTLKSAYFCNSGVFSISM
jgi:CRP-like cAMP-binding protein